MELQLKHIKAYNLGENGIKMLTSKDQGAIKTVITSLDFTDESVVYGCSYLNIDDGNYPYTLQSVKLILRDIEDITAEEARDLGWVDEEHLKRGIRAGLITMNNQEYLVSEEYDIFGLIENDLAIRK